MEDAFSEILEVSDTEGDSLQHLDFIVAAFGEAGIIETFKAKVANVYGENATLDVEESLAVAEDVPAEDIMDQPAAMDGDMAIDATPAV